MITLHDVFLLAGALFAAMALLSAFDRDNKKRLGNTLFWGLVATSFLAGDRIGDFANGLLVVALAMLAGFGALGRSNPPTTSPEERQARAKRRGDWLFLPALVIPAVAFAGSVFLKTTTWHGVLLFEPKQATLVSLGLGVVVALLVAMLWLRPKPLAPLQESRRLMDSVGWAAMLPQTLAALGVVFTLAGVGTVVGDLAAAWIPTDNRLAVVVTYTVGSALLTMITGNGFTAFPVMTAGIGLPLIVKKFGGDPAIMSAIGMLSAFCGTLMTPMAANFNIVPAILLELPDRNGVIKVQIPTALLLLAANTALMYALVFRF